MACNIPVKWALPGKERQDSVLSGFKEIDADALLVAIHDSARPLVTADDLRCRALAWLCIVALLHWPPLASKAVAMRSG